jgi:hypothetical protein
MIESRYSLGSKLSSLIKLANFPVLIHKQKYFAYGLITKKLEIFASVSGYFSSQKEIRKSIFVWAVRSSNIHGAYRMIYLQTIVMELHGKYD